MKGKIKILSLVMAVAMVGSMFAGCTSKPATTTESKEPTATESKKEEKPAEKPAEVQEISWYFGGAAPSKPDAVVEALNKKSVEDIGVKVNFKFTSDAAVLQTALATGDSDLDIAFACAWFADYVGSAQKNSFIDLTTLLPEKAPLLWKELPEDLWNGAKVGGKIYGIPVWKDVAATQFWIARKDILEAAKATEEFNKTGLAISTVTPVLEKIKAWHDADPAKNLYSEGNTAPINFNKAGINGHDNMWDTIKGEVRLGIRIDPAKKGNTTVQSYYTDPAYVADLKTLKEWADKGLSNGKVAVTMEEEPKLATIGTAQGWDGAQFGAWGGPAKGYEAVVHPKTTPILTTTTAQGALNCLGAGSKKADASLKYLEYVNTNAEYRNMLTYGIEGTNWQKATKDDITKFYADSLKDGSTTQAYIDEYTKTAEGKVVQRLTGQDWTLWNFAAGSWKYLIPEIGNSPDMHANIFKQNDAATPSEILGFSPDISKVSTQFTACTSIVKEYENKLQCGAVTDVDATIAELLGKLDKQGYQDMIKDFQAQVDAFRAAK